MINEHKVVEQDLSASSSALTPSLLSSPACLPSPFNFLLSCQLGSLCSGLNPPFAKLCLALISIKMLSTCMFHNFSYCIHNQFIASILKVQLESKQSSDNCILLSPYQNSALTLSAIKKGSHDYYNFHFYPAPTSIQNYVAGK